MGSVYNRLGESIADDLFGSEFAGRPVYALADTETLERIAAGAGLEGDALAAITTVVRQTLALDDAGVSPFSWHAQASRGHRRHPLEVPPALPLLLVLTLAAERMHADAGLASHNYYSRLHQLLTVPSERQHRVEEDYRRHAEELWGSLNAWLEAWEGERGIPTAYTVGGHAYVGLPLSQAVVRQHDRSGLHDVFSLEGLTPGLRLSPGDMGVALDPYVTAAPSPLSSHISHLWKVPTAREHIIDAACLELEAWDGSGSQSATGAGQRLGTRLIAFLTTFPRKRVTFNLMLPCRSTEPAIAQFETAQGTIDIPTVPGSGGSTRLANFQEINSSSLVSDALSGTLRGDAACGFARRPRRVTPLRWDDLQGAYVEVERTSLGEDSLVLAKDDARSRVEAHFEVHARPGWRELPQLAGLPEGWLAYEHVQIISAPAKQIHADLLPLAPSTRTSLTLRGGFVLPGLLRKWSSLEPPEIVAVAAGATTVSVRVYAGTRIDQAAIAVDVEQADEVLVVSLQEHQLEDGEYVVAMYVDGASRPSSTAVLRLRSADSPQFSVDDVDIRLVYSPDSGLTWPLRAGPADWSRFVNGARLVELRADRQPETEGMREYRPRNRPRATPEPARTRVGFPMANDSCLVTGMHRFLLPPVMPGRPQRPTIQGECSTCGLVRRFAGTPWAARRRDPKAASATRPFDIPPIVDSAGVDFLVAFDALNHVGHGSLATFERIASQVEGSGLFADTFLRRQEILGHIDVARDDWFQVTEWAVNTATLVPVEAGHWTLIGARSGTLVGQLRELIGAGGEVSESADAQFVRVEVIGTLPPAEVLSQAGIEVVSASPALAMAASLPRLSEVASNLKRIAVPLHRTAELWDTTSASWRVVESLAAPGAYRLKDFRSFYTVRSAQDLEDGTVAIGNAQLVKHIANLWANDPLAGYHSSSGSVVVPLGADLPGIYGRALSVCSGRAPREVVEHRMLQYPSVPRAVADTIFTKISQ